MGESSLSSEVSAVTVLPEISNITAIYGSSGGVELTWQREDESPDGGFDIERSTDGGSTWSDVATNLSTTTSSYTDTSASNGTVYDYQVERNTDHVSVTTNSVPVDLLPITNITITDAGTDDELTLSWDIQDGISEYYIYQSEEAGKISDKYTQVASTSSPPYTDTGLEDGEKYYYWVDIN